MTAAQSYRLRQSDTLEGAAAKLLGSPDRWPELAALNALRWPFISERPVDQLGLPFATGRLTAPLLADSPSVDLMLLSPTLVVVGGALYLEARVATGGLLNTTLRLSAVGTPEAGGWTTLTFAVPPTVDWPVDTQWTLTGNPDTLTTRVLRPGDLLLLPAGVTVPSDVVVTTVDVVDERLGDDILIDERTQLLRWDGPRHDLATVRGRDNLVQAVRLRLETEPMELPLHPTYGNPLLPYVGQRDTLSFAALAEGYLRSALLQEVRLDAVEAMAVTVQLDQVVVDLILRLRGGAGLLAVNSLGLPLPR